MPPPRGMDPALSGVFGMYSPHEQPQRGKQREVSMKQARRRTKTLGWAAVAAAVGVGALGVTSSAQAAKGLEVQVQDDAIFLNQQYYNRQTAFAQSKAMGATVIRSNIIWAQIVNNSDSRSKPRSVTYNWSKQDNLLAAAKAAGLKVYFTLTGPAPAWATGNHRRGIDRPSATQFGIFASEAAKHFKGKRVVRYSIWNEPNIPAWLTPTS